MLFDPRQFMNENPDPSIDQFELDVEILKNYAVKCTRLRERFKQDTDLHHRQSIQVHDNQQESRSRKGLIMSTRRRNAEGMSEQQLRELR